MSKLRDEYIATRDTLVKQLDQGEITQEIFDEKSNEQLNPYKDSLLTAARDRKPTFAESAKGVIAGIILVPILFIMKITGTRFELPR